MERWPLPEGWEWRTLAEVCEINPRRPTIQRNDDVPTSFVPMAAVDEVEGRFATVQIRPYREVKRGYTYFEENDVVFAKITPCMENGKAAIAQGLLDGFGFGTTEFHVLRPHLDVLPEWIHRYVRQLNFREEAKKHFRGAVGQQRVPQEFLESSLIPLPYPDDPARSLETQRRIVARLDALLAEVAAARRLHAEIAEDTARVMEAVLREVFLDPFGELPPSWTVKTVDQISTPPQYGYTQSAESEPVGPKFLRITDIQNGQVDWTAVPHCEITERDLMRYRLQDRDIVFARSGATTGKTFLVRNPPEAVFASYLIRLQIIRHSTPDFVYWFFQSPYYWSQIVPRGGAQPNMNAQVLRQIVVPIPLDISVQNQIANYLYSIQQEIVELRNTQEREKDLLNYTEQTILSHAFRGEL